MACLVENDHHFTITIPCYETVDGVTHYRIVVTVGTVSWKVLHRYKDFVELHETLVSDHCLTKEMLPQKKFIGNRDPEFIEKRRANLEVYLQTVVNFLQRALPQVLIKFLEFHKYDVLYILQSMANKFFKEGDSYLQKSWEYTFDPIELHAISERLQKCCYPNESCGGQFDFIHILDFCYKLKTVIIRGGRNNVGTSTLLYNNLTFELSVFKSAMNLYCYNVQLQNIYDLGCARQTVNSLVFYNCNIKRFSDVLLCDKLHKDYQDAAEQPQLNIWNTLTYLDASWNELSRIDESISLAPNLRNLTLDGNRIEKIENTELLPNLTNLCICANSIVIEECLFNKLKKVTHLNLSQNKITNLMPFAKLIELKELNLASNLVEDPKQIKHVANLPRLDYLVLTGNPVSTIIDYRVKVFEYFNERASFLCLDNERPSQKELDTAAVLRALTVVREGKRPSIVPLNPVS